jgi:DNA-binding protein HU-beta
MEATLMVKAELIERIAEELHETKKIITPVVEKVFSSITDALAKGEKCTFVDFGVFEVKDRAAREGRNPQDPTKIVKIPAKKAPVFRPGKALKEKVAGTKAKKKK